MKVLKTISALCVATLISFAMSAQATQTTPAAKTDSKATATGKTAPAATTKSDTKPAAKNDSKATATGKTATAATAKSDTKTAKPADAVNKDLKGPKGETVYTGPKGGNYYLTPSGEKKYLPKSK